MGLEFNNQIYIQPQSEEGGGGGGGSTAGVGCAISQNIDLNKLIISTITTKPTYFSIQNIQLTAEGGSN